MASVKYILKKKAIPEMIKMYHDMVPIYNYDGKKDVYGSLENRLKKVKEINSKSKKIHRILKELKTRVKEDNLNIERDITG